MDYLLSTRKLVLLAFFGVCGLPVVLGNPVELQPRLTCNADNCLRQLRAATKSPAASAYCLTYYTSTTTVTSFTTVPALGATFPGRKRDVAEPTPTSSSPTPGEDLEIRQAPTPTYVSKCTEFPSALSSGCSCLLGTNAVTNVATVTSTSTLALPAACSASNNYGLSNTAWSIYNLPGGQGASGLGFEVLPGGCCAYCLASPNCIGYYEQLGYHASDPAKVACSIEILGNQPLEPLGNPTCPLGLATLTTDAPQTTALYGIGPCATLIAT